jgi:hypothetical protein
VNKHECTVLHCILLYCAVVAHAHAALFLSDCPAVGAGRSLTARARRRCWSEEGPEAAPSPTPPRPGGSAAYTQSINSTHVTHIPSSSGHLNSVGHQSRHAARASYYLSTEAAVLEKIQVLAVGTVVQTARESPPMQSVTH